MTGSHEASLGRVGRAALAGTVVGGAILASGDSITFLFFATYGAVGAFLAIRRPRNTIGWLLIAIAFGFIATTTNPADVDIDALIRGDGTTRDALVVWLSGWGGWATYVGFIALTIIFPSGRLPEARGRRGAIILLAAGVTAVVLTAVAPTIGVAPDGVTTIHVPNPVAVLPDLPLWSAIPQDGVVLVVIALLIIAVVRMVLRYRHAAGIERLQLRWLVAAVAFVVFGVVFGLASIVILGEAVGGAGWIPVIIAYPTIPLAIGISVMRYRLFEIDRIISRTLSWAVVTGLLVTVFGGAVVALQAHPGRRHPGPDAGRGGIHARGVRLVPADPPACPVSGGPALRPGPLRRAAHRRRVRTASAR